MLIRREGDRDADAIRAVTVAAFTRPRRTGEALLGDTRYYRWFGFLPSAAHGVTPPDPGWREHFQVRPLSCCQPGLRGTFRYAKPFDRT